MSTVQRPAKGKSASAITRAVREAMVEGAEYWHTNMMPQHFTSGAAAKYNYAPRTRKYMRRKASKMGHQRGLEYSGHSRMQAKEDYNIRGGSIAGRPSGTVSMSMPSYFVQHPKGSTFIDKPAELTRTTSDEERELAGVVTRAVAERLGRSMPSRVSAGRVA